MRKLLLVLALLGAGQLIAAPPKSGFHAVYDSLPSVPVDSTGLPDSLQHVDTHSLSDSITLPDSVHLTDSITQAQKDSILQDMRLLLDLLQKPKSVFIMETSVGNRNFSLHNNTINARQNSNNMLTFVPAVSYMHKSGLGISAAGYMTWERQPQFFQYAISPSYDHFGKKVSFGLSYTYYIRRDDLEYYSTPVQHEIYGYLSAKKGWLRPQLNVGWASGDFREITKFDTVIRGIRRTIFDTSTVKLQDFSVMGSLTHEFKWRKLFSGNDQLTLLPQLSLVVASQHIETQNKGKLVIHTLDRKFVRRYTLTDSQNTGLHFESLAFAMNVSYFTGPVYVMPQYYLSYFLGQTDKKFSQIFSISIGILL